MPASSSHPPIDCPSGLEVYYRGAPPDQGPLPALFYFALSGEESLYLDPFNQPAAFLEGRPIRVFSSTLPSHGKGRKNTEAMARWAEEIKAGHDPFGEFLDQCRNNIDFLIQQGVIEENRIAVAGLSRGGFLGTHLAALEPRISHVLGYAPMTSLAAIGEFQGVLDNPIVQKWNLENAIPDLVDKKVRFYIGNLDTRVGTEDCFAFITKMAKAARHRNIRSPAVEMIISPSIGHKGHGTPPHIFQSGVDWIVKELLS